MAAKPFCAMSLNLYAILAFVSVLSIAVQSCASLHVVSVLDLSGVSFGCVFISRSSSNHRTFGAWPGPYDETKGKRFAQSFLEGRSKDSPR